MASIKLNKSSINEMRAFYHEELTKTLRRLDHINKVIEQLGGSAPLDMNIEDFKLRASSGSVLKGTTKKRVYKKRPGPKSKWDKVILGIIKDSKRPLTYEEITTGLMKVEGKKPTERSKMKATVQNTVFRMRGSRSLRTFTLGARVKYIAPSNWFDSSGELKSEYDKNLRESKPKFQKKTKTVAKKRSASTGKKKGGTQKKTKKRSSAAKKGLTTKLRSKRKAVTKKVVKRKTAKA